MKWQEFGWSDSLTLPHNFHHYSFKAVFFSVKFSIQPTAHNSIIAAILGPYFETHNYVANNFKEQVEENIRAAAPHIGLT